MRFVREGLEGAGFSGQERARAYDNVFTDVAFTRVRWNSRILTAGVGLSTSHTGRSHMPGLSVPSPDPPICPAVAA